ALCRPTLARGEIHVLVVDTTQPWHDEIDRELLDVSERARLSRLKSEVDRSRFLRRRIARREILGAYSGVAPGDLAFVTNRWGKPALDPSSSAVGLHFNASHSG